MYNIVVKIYNICFRFSFNYFRSSNSYTFTFVFYLAMRSIEKRWVLPFLFGSTVMLAGPDAEMETFMLTPLKQA